jgi:hypothetical protein
LVLCHAASVRCGRAGYHPQRPHRTRTTPVQRSSRINRP